jgi:hypothetical protein
MSTTKTTPTTHPSSTPAVAASPTGKEATKRKRTLRKQTRIARQQQARLAPPSATELPAAPAPAAPAPAAGGPTDPRVLRANAALDLVDQIVAEILAEVVIPPGQPNPARIGCEKYIQSMVDVLRSAEALPTMTGVAPDALAAQLSNAVALETIDHRCVAARKTLAVGMRAEKCAAWNSALGVYSCVRRLNVSAYVSSQVQAFEAFMATGPRRSAGETG